MTVYRLVHNGELPAVRVGKSFRFTVEAASEDDARRKVDEVCERFLTNPVIEDAVVTVGAGS